MNDSEFKQILEVADEAIITMNSEHLIILFNSGAERMFGYESDEVVGQPINVLIPERFHELHTQHVAEFETGPQAARKMNERGQIRGKRKNGKEFPALASILKSKTREGKRHFTVIMRDISLIVAAADHLRGRIHELEGENLALARSKRDFENAEFLLDRLLRESHSF